MAQLGWGGSGISPLTDYNKWVTNYINSLASYKTTKQHNPKGYYEDYMQPAQKSSTISTPTTQQTTPQTVQMKAPEFNYSGGFNWKSMIPQLPQTPQVTQQMIADWIKRAQSEAGLQFDPQLLAVRQALEKSLLASEASKGGINPAYEEAISEIQKWQEKALGDEQKRWYARGLGRGGGLIESETEIEKSAMGEKSKLAQEKAQTIADIEKQEALLKQQAAEQETGIEKSRGQYITARQAELREAYEQRQTELSQQMFANQMAIAQFGLTAETQSFNQALSQYELDLDKWYKNSLVSLEQQSQAMASAYASGTAGENKYENMIFDNETGTYITYPQYLAKKELALASTPEEKDYSDLWTTAFANRVSGWSPSSTSTWLSGYNVPQDTLDEWMKTLYDLGQSSSSAGGNIK